MNSGVKAFLAALAVIVVIALAGWLSLDVVIRGKNGFPVYQYGLPGENL